MRKTKPMTRRIVFSDNEILYLTDSPSEYASLLSENKCCIPVYNKPESIDGFPHTRYVLEDIDMDAGGCDDLNQDDLDMDYLYKVFQRLNNLPWKILDTERLSLRESTVEDVDIFYDIYAKDPDIEKYVETLFDNPEDEKLYQKNYISKIYELYDFGVWTIELKKTGQIIGRAGLSIIDGYDYPDLGFIIDKDKQNQGYAYEICGAILKYAYETLGFETIQARVKPENEKSIHLLKKLGFTIPENRTPCDKDGEYLIAVIRL